MTTSGDVTGLRGPGIFGATILALLICVDSPYANDISIDENGDFVSQYEVRIDSDNPLIAHVTARLHATEFLRMSQNCPNYDYPEGWASFISDLTVTNNGRPVEARYASKSTWEIDANLAGPIELEYDVSLTYTTVDWDVGNEQGGYFDKQAVYTVSKALFIHGDGDESFRVAFDIPDSWSISVPWVETETKNQFSVPNLEYLIENSLVYGNYATSSVQKNGFLFEFALLGKASEASELFDDTFGKIVTEYMTIFPNTAPSKFLVSMFYANQDDGESFFNSNAFTLEKELQADGAIIWANQMAHEMFHYWSSDLIRADSYEDSQWFSEGFTEYYSTLTLLRTGIINEPMYRNKIEKIIGLYQNFKWRNPEITLKEAGQNKGRDRFAVYNGGWVAALALDLLIIEKTGGAKNLDDLMRELHRRFNVTPYKFVDLVATASEVTEEDISEFFDRYVDGNEVIPVEDSLNKIGYKMYNIVYEAETYLVPQSGSEIRALWLRENAN